MAITVDFLSGLYNRHSCYADRLTPEQLDAIHIQTPMEDALRKWITGKKDVVLLGNPGDGKTHLLRRLEDLLARMKAEVVLDATAESDYAQIVKRWKGARSKRRPFCLAINQGPLNQLLSLHDTQDVLREVKEQTGQLLYYDQPPKKPKDVFVIDLNLQSVLTPEIVERALSNLLKDTNFDSCPECVADETCDAMLNRRAFQHAQVRVRLVRLLEAAGHTGRHITMRDLQGFLSFLLFGGRTCTELARQETSLDGRYFNLCFQGEGDLFDAVRDVFDPVRATLPGVDEDLWENTGVRDGWVFSRPPLTPDHYPDAWDQFVALKRQYFFEHADGEKLFALVGGDDQLFLELLQSGGGTADRYLARVMQALNRFYCPDMPDDSQFLRLWGAQQYDGHAPRVLVSCYRVDRGKFSLQVPRVAPWLETTLNYRPDHVLLRHTGSSSNPVGLRIDRGLWRALMLASRGMPFGLRSPQYAQSLQTFMTKLHRLEANTQAMETAIIYNFARGQRTQVLIDRNKGQYVRP